HRDLPGGASGPSDQYECHAPPGCGTRCDNILCECHQARRDRNRRLATAAQTHARTFPNLSLLEIIPTALWVARLPLGRARQVLQSFFVMEET
ncbi:MAG: hypothetical protein M3Z19_06920, partial [Chloroflexota bacterium]|nr:hypothetical protein [Chloroflexota bacterium]